MTVDPKVSKRLKEKYQDRYTNESCETIGCIFKQKQELEAASKELNVENDLPEYELEEVSCMCTEAGLEAEWFWDSTEHCWKCAGCNKIQ